MFPRIADTRSAKGRAQKLSDDFFLTDPEVIYRINNTLRAVERLRESYHDRPNKVTTDASIRRLDHKKACAKQTATDEAVATVSDTNEEVRQLTCRTRQYRTLFSQADNIDTDAVAIDGESEDHLRLDVCLKGDDDQPRSSLSMDDHPLEHGGKRKRWQSQHCSHSANAVSPREHDLFTMDDLRLHTDKIFHSVEQLKISGAGLQTQCDFSPHCVRDRSI